MPNSPKLTEEQRRLAANNIGLVGEMIKRVEMANGLGMNRDDLFADGLSSLVNCARRFDPKRGVRFSTYACNGIFRNATSDLRDRAHRLNSLRSFVNNHPPKQHYHMPPTQMELDEEAQLVKDMIATIPEEDRETFLRHVMHGEKICDIVGRDESLYNKRRSFGNKIRAIKDKLRKRFAHCAV
jgi:RNA polymerase sigma factor (sigma-70 family)